MIFKYNPLLVSLGLGILICCGKLTHLIVCGLPVAPILGWLRPVSYLVSVPL